MATIEERIAKRRAELSGGSIEDRIAKRRAELSDPRAAAIAAAKTGTLQASPESLAAAAQADQTAEDEMVLAAEGPVFPRLASAVRGVPFAGEYMDEAAGALKEGGTERMRAAQGAMERQRPGQNIALQVGTGVMSAIPAAVAAAPAVASMAPTALSGQVGAAIGAGAVAGGVEGAVSGYGRGTSADERKGESVEGGIYGAGAGGVLAGVAPAVSKGVRNLVDWVKQSDVGVIARELGVSPKAAKIIRQAIDADDPMAARATIQEVGDEAILGDSGPATRQLLDTSMSEGGAALRIGREAVDSRAAVTTPQLRQAFDNILGAPEGTKAAARDIASKSAATRKAAYDAAYRSPIDYASDTGRAIESVLDRVPADTMRAAVKEANEAMQEAGERNLQILLDLDTGALKEMPNVRQLDELKKALGAVAEANKDDFGRLNAAGVRASRLARDLKRATGDAVPVYGRAVKLGGDKIAEDNALALGRSALKDSTTIEDVADAMKDASKAEKTAFKQGLRNAIEDEMSRVKAVMSDPDAYARESGAIFKALSSRKTRGKIEAAIGKPATERITRLMRKELPMLETRGAVARGSQTAYRRAGQEAITEELTPGMVGEAARGQPVNAAKRIFQVINDTTPQADAGRRAKVLEEIATALTQKKGRGAEKALTAIHQAMRGQPISNAQSRLIANLVGGSVPLAGYPTATRLQASQ